MTRDRELENLRKQLAVSKQKSKIAKARFDVELEKKNIKRELFLLKNPTASRLGRGFKVLVKGVGKSIAGQAVLIKERQMQVAKKSKKKRGSSVSGFDPLALDF